MDLSCLGSFLEHQDARGAQISAPEDQRSDGWVDLHSGKSTGSDEWLFEWGSPSEVLEFTRAQVFEEMLRLRDDERQRIGQELHDSAGQLLLSLQLSVARLREMENGTGHESLVEEIQDTTHLIGQEIRSLAFLNHPAKLNQGNLTSALQALIQGFGKRTGCKVSFEVDDDRPTQTAACSMVLLRVAQEALVNIHRHAHASCITAKLKTRGNALELTICDDGVGLPSENQISMNGGVGLHGMKFRVEQIGGRFHIDNLKHGTMISARVPLAA